MTSRHWHTDTWLLEVNNGLRALRELDPAIATRMVYGADAQGKLSFGLITFRPPGLPQLSEAVSVMRSQREHDDKWILLLTLEDKEFSEVFIQLCSHVYTKVSATKNEPAGITAAMSCFEEWRQLFLGRQRRQLTVEECRGLFAELDFGFHQATKRIEPGFVVECWQGPFGGDQDFQFPNVHYEIKSRHPSSHALQISSEYQLYGDKIVLVALEVIDSTKPLPGSLSLPQLTELIRQTLGADKTALANFDTAIDELGFDPNDDCYAERFFRIDGIDFFSVREGFPRITAKDLPIGVAGVRYKLELDALTEFILDAETALNQAANNEDVIGT